jgi:ArsR family transcriptional regulator, arsenate/arsenite/antimonite-responsive transcriptional repressor
MAFSKAHLFDEDDQLLSHFAKSFSHPARIGIIRFLLKSNPSTVEDLSKGYPLSASTMSQHLEILRKGGFVECWEDFPNTYYKPHLQNIENESQRMAQFLYTLSNLNH